MTAVICRSRSFFFLFHVFTVTARSGCRRILLLFCFFLNKEGDGEEGETRIFLSCCAWMLNSRQFSFFFSRSVSPFFRPFVAAVCGFATRRKKKKRQITKAAREKWSANARLINQDTRTAMAFEFFGLCTSFYLLLLFHEKNKTKKKRAHTHVM